VYKKSHQLPYLKNDKTRPKKTKEFFHSNVYDPTNILSLGNAKYFVLLIDDFNKFRFILCMKKKGEVLECFKKVKAKRLQITRIAMVKFRSENGGEYISYAFKEYFAEAKIKHETSIFYYLQQNNKQNKAT